MMTYPDKVIIGIDVSKDALKTAYLDDASDQILLQRSEPNTPTGHQNLIEEASKYPEVHLVMEATGTYHRRLSKALLQAGLQQSVVNPLQIKRFSQLQLHRPKTDACDAVTIARYGSQQRPKAHQPDSPLQQQLKQIVGLSQQLIKQRTALKNLQHAYDQLPERAAVCDEVLHAQIDQINQQLSVLEQERDALIDQEFAHVRALIESVQGIGPKTACALIAFVGDLSSFESYKQLTAYVGLDPLGQQSGTSLAVSGSISKRGNAYLRTLLYLCAQSARHHNRSCQALYDRLRAAGKPKKVALIAVANKLVKQLCAVVKSQRPFDNHYAENNMHAA